MAADFAQSVKQQADIVKIIGDYVRLKKSGAQNYQGLCPFHSEKSPSFSVHATRQFYHCFGCGQSGDVFTFLQKIENLSFPESVRAVAQKCGIALPKRDFNSPEEAQESRQRGKLLDLHEAATTFFQDQLKSPEGATAREYLTSRGVPADAIAKFRIGYAGESFTGLRDRLAKLADAETLRASGLFSWKEQEDGSPGNLYDRFRKRITFPIANESGRVIAFTARALDTAATGNEKAGPKYLNSPETPLYSKGQVLFNLDKARAAIRQHNFALLVEGQMDCIAVSMTGVQNVLATSGTAFTEHQVNLLKRYCTQVVVNFDPDTAGANAAEKSIGLLTGASKKSLDLLTEERFNIRVLTLPDGLDPDRYIREFGAQNYIAQLKSAKRYEEYVVDRALTLFPPTSSDSKSKAIEFLRPYVRRQPTNIARHDFVNLAVTRLRLDSALLIKELKDAAAPSHIAATSPAVPATQAERIFIQALSDKPDEPLFRRAALLFDSHPSLFEGYRCSLILKHLRQNAQDNPLERLDGAEDRALVSRILHLHQTTMLTPEILDSAANEFMKSDLSRKQRDLRVSIGEAERKGDWGKVAELSGQKMRLDRQLRELDH